MDFEKKTTVFMEYVLYYNYLQPNRDSAFYNSSVSGRLDITKCLMASSFRIFSMHGIYTALSLGT